jgi:parallel beta-helix repeat protein
MGESAVKSSTLYNPSLLRFQVIKYWFCIIIQLILYSICFATKPLATVDIGILKDYYSVKSIGDATYQFSITKPVTVSIFFNGLSAGYQAQLLDSSQKVLDVASNQGTYWSATNDTATLGKAITINLPASTYYLNVTATSVLGNPLYRDKDLTYTLNIFPDNAPNTVIVAASDSPVVGKPQFIATGTNDEITINKAINQAAKYTSGRVLLRPGTYHINNNVLVNYDGMTIIGTGWGTILKMDANAVLSNAGLIRSRYKSSSQDAAKPYFSNQTISHFVIDGSMNSTTNFMYNEGNFGTYTNSVFNDVRIHDFTRYGYDPHLSSTGTIYTNGFVIDNALSDHNGVDGIVCDACYQSRIQSSIVDANGRHGINLVTYASFNTVTGNTMTNNGYNGITVQPGPDLTTRSDNNIISYNTIQLNVGNGVYISDSDFNNINNNNISQNGMHGVHLYSASSNTIDMNTINNNSQSSLNGYCGVFISDDASIYSINNTITSNNLYTVNPFTYRFGIAEEDSFDDGNRVITNHLANIDYPIRLLGASSIDQGNVITMKIKK